MKSRALKNLPLTKNLTYPRWIWRWLGQVQILGVVEDALEIGGNAFRGNTGLLSKSGNMRVGKVLDGHEAIEG